MYESLTQQEKWGFEYAAQQRGGGVTPESIALESMRLQGSKYYRVLEQAKWALVKQAVDNADPAQIAALLVQFGISDILQPSG